MTEFKKLLRDDLHAAADSVNVRVSPDAVAAELAAADSRKSGPGARPSLGSDALATLLT